MPHSHMDAGWLYTYDEYYTRDVIDIFQSVIGYLNREPSATYTVGDIAFFRRFYEGESMGIKAVIKRLVKEG